MMNHASNWQNQDSNSGRCIQNLKHCALLPVKAKEASKGRRVERIKRQATGWGEIFAKDISDKMLLSKTYKELPKLNKKQSDLKMG